LKHLSLFFFFLNGGELSGERGAIRLQRLALWREARMSGTHCIIPPQQQQQQQQQQ